MNLLTRFCYYVTRGLKAKASMLALGVLGLVQPVEVAFAASASVRPGTVVTYIASAEGTPAPTFQWRKNGTAIAGATTSVLILPAVTTADAATYQVVATNEVGSATSPDEVLVVEENAPTNVAPSFQTHPVASQSLAAGTTATFSVVASGTPTPTYQWHKNGAAILGATNASFTLPAITTHDAATYTAVATNAAGSATSNASVLLVLPGTPTNVAPSFTVHPTPNQTAYSGGSVTLTVSATGVPAPTYQWQKNGVVISGATNATLSLPVLNLSDSGTYVAIAVNSAGSATSNAGVLQVNGSVVPLLPPVVIPVVPTDTAPVFATQPTPSQTVVGGTNVTLTASATGNPTPTYQWRKNGENIAGATTGTLYLRAVTAADAATYTLAATNAAGTAISNDATLTVNLKPVITVQPVPVAVVAGASASFNVSVSAIPGATLQWRKNNVAIAGATNSVLSFQSTTTADAGTYTVVATNPLGSVTSRAVTLVIGVPPVITKQPISRSVTPRSNVVFSASATGTPAPTFQWKKNGTKIGGATSATLSLKTVAKGDAGEYWVEATNVAGWVSSNRVTLTVMESLNNKPTDDEALPATRDDTAVIDTGSRLVNLSVRANAGSENNGLIVGFVVGGSVNKPVLIRGIGPTLGQFGVAGALSDPTLSLYAGSRVAAINDDWMSNDNADQIMAMSARVGAFSLTGATADSVLMSTLESGAYTVQVSGKQAGPGVALVEVYDAAAGNSANLVNLSVRAHVGSGADAPNVGFVISGTAPKQVLIRAVGPTLAAFGVGNAITDPQVELYKGTTRVEQNDNWGGAASLSETFARVGAFGFADGSSRDAVLLVTLTPGAYTVVVSGANGASGTGLVELYEVP